MKKKRSGWKRRASTVLQWAIIAGVVAPPLLKAFGIVGWSWAQALGPLAIVVSLIFVAGAVVLWLDLFGCNAKVKWGD